MVYGVDVVCCMCHVIHVPLAFRVGCLDVGIIPVSSVAEPWGNCLIFGYLLIAFLSFFFVFFVGSFPWICFSFPLRDSIPQIPLRIFSLKPYIVNSHHGTCVAVHDRQAHFSAAPTNVKCQASGQAPRQLLQQALPRECGYRNK